MTEHDFAVLGARLLLIQRYHLPMRAVAVLPDDAAMAIAGAALSAEDEIARGVTR